MEDMLSSVLETGEEVLWRGKPETFETLDKTNKPAIGRHGSARHDLPRNSVPPSAAEKKRKEKNQIKFIGTGLP